MDFKEYQIDEKKVQARLNAILVQDFTNLNTKDALRIILSVIDLTTLEGSDTINKIKDMCYQAKRFKVNGPDIPNVAAVCFYPPFAALAKRQLKDTGISVACVAGAFPSGQAPLEVRIAEVRYAVEQGADEIDMVISRGKFLEGDFEYVFNEVKSIKEACGKAHLKVILETGELGTLSNIRTASDIAIAAGADFIKTSTGKIPQAATLEAFIIMLDAIKEHYEKTGQMIGIKPAGGIRDAEEALKYLLVLDKVLGEKWMNNTWFRIGASSLANNVLKAILTPSK
ncbi:MAG: deoxyribose-phosphate aldolase [Bacteroidales bacterium]|nr:deoxyribose-phosphate aldolase [Bacteroidales bacterium]